MLSLAHRAERAFRCTPRTTTMCARAFDHRVKRSDLNMHGELGLDDVSESRRYG